MDSGGIGQKRARDGKAAALYIFDERKKKERDHLFTVQYNLRAMRKIFLFFYHTLQTTQVKTSNKTKDR